MGDDEKVESGKVEYPKWVYGRKGEPRLVKNKSQLDALGGGFSEEPPLAPKTRQKRTQEENDLRFATGKR